MYYSKIDNSVSSPQLGYHCLFVNILLYVIVFGYVCLLNCLYIFFNCSLIDDRSLFGLYFNKNYLLTYLYWIRREKVVLQLFTITNVLRGDADRKLSLTYCVHGASHQLNKFSPKTSSELDLARTKIGFTFLGNVCVCVWGGGDPSIRKISSYFYSRVPIWVIG